MALFQRRIELLRSGTQPEVISFAELQELFNQACAKIGSPEEDEYRAGMIFLQELAKDAQSAIAATNAALQ